ncbi:hypothetical protein [Mycobacteroides abscessus]|uniref:hypothetical protein n=1 Tax=Mycobacteroides abscessus TaxID=36809 RepID=UPI0009A811E5|nr:hypothetical protein [Mycobacteroides abscessus]SLH41723.1 Uncharacterised protein [Mycobacteroides abscessus subsp. massiliense]
MEASNDQGDRAIAEHVQAVEVLREQMVARVADKVAHLKPCEDQPIRIEINEIDLPAAAIDPADVVEIDKLLRAGRSLR